MVTIPMVASQASTPESNIEHFGYSQKGDYCVCPQGSKLTAIGAGEEYVYGNSGHFLLGRIVKKASGQSLRLFAQEHIFSSLGMKSTLFCDNNNDLIKNRAFSYSTKNGEDGYNNVMLRNDHVGGTGLYKTIENHH